MYFKFEIEIEIFTKRELSDNGFFFLLQLTHHQDSIVQIVLISESRRLQASLSTYGVITQTPEEISPVQIWSQWDMVKVYEKLGQSERE